MSAPDPTALETPTAAAGETGIRPAEADSTDPTLPRPVRLWRSRDKRFALGLALAAAVGVVVFVLFANAVLHPAVPGAGSSNTSGGGGNDAPPGYTVLVPAGTVLQIAGGAYEEIPFSLDNSSILNGTFKATAPVVAYIMQPGEYQNLSKGATPSKAGYLWTSGSITTESIDPVIDIGSYYFVFENPGGSATTLTVTSDIDSADFDTN